MVIGEHARELSQSFVLKLNLNSTTDSAMRLSLIKDAFARKWRLRSQSGLTNSLPVKPSIAKLPEQSSATQRRALVIDSSKCFKLLEPFAFLQPADCLDPNDTATDKVNTSYPTYAGNNAFAFVWPCRCSHFWNGIKRKTSWNLAQAAVNDFNVIDGIRKIRAAFGI